MSKYISENFAKAFFDKGEPVLSYQKGMSGEERREWKRKLKAKVTELMAFPDTMYDTPVVNKLLSKQRDGYRIEKYEISPEPDFWMTFFVLIPDTASPEYKTPGVLCMPGTKWTKEALCGEDFSDLDYEPAQPPIGIGHRYYYANMQAVHFARKGMTALACEDICVGEHAGSMEPVQVEKLLIGQGRSMMGVTVEIRLAMMKWLKSQPFVDRDRLAISAHSLGVDSGMLMATLDEDIKAFVYNDFICDWRKRVAAICPPEKVPTTSWHMYSGMWKWFSYPDLLAAFAPRKLFITEGGRTEYLEMVANSYAECNASENFRYDYYRKFADPSKRVGDFAPLPAGISGSEYLELCNVDSPKHFFKFETAVPWLEEALK